MQADFIDKNSKGVALSTASQEQHGLDAVEKIDTFVSLRFLAK
jgi:hypothetical protein